ncbi:phage tail family protein [Staphylococcus epidermidis]|uniref:phage tail domain-containing protein n=1 Tax=Staphylococcus epidermidis TaxID=1282 RepID=UPI001C407176|nr:phage tail domain-containing protein [Staphylococcus epidermidis]
MILHDVEVYKNKERLRISDNRFTGTALRVVSYDVKGAGYDRKFDEIDRVNGRFHNATKEEKKSISMTVRYDVEKIAYASHLKANIQDMLRGHFYLRELAASESEIKFENIFEPKEQSFELEYVDGRQILVGLVNEVSFDTTKTSGEFTLDFETIELPYFESIGYSTDLEKESGNLNKWGITDKNPFNTSHKERRYTFYDTKVGDVYYGGTAEINQFNQDSVVEMTLGENVSKNDSDGFNFYMTHSDIMKISGLELRAGDVIKFDGIHVYRNNLRIDDYNKTKQQPVLMPGWNTFHTTKVLKKIRFKHKRYYL